MYHIYQHTISNLQILKSLISRLRICIFILFSFLILGCSQSGTGKGAENAPRIVFLGTIQTAHIESDVYPLSLLRKTIETINPDIIITEIPPDRFDEAMNEFQQSGFVREPRVARFPEYTEVILPLSKVMNFKIIPAAVWSKPTAEFRQSALNAIIRDPARARDWASHLAAEASMNQKLSGKEDDPFFIHTDEYDQIIKEGLTPYATLFDGDLGPGGWDQVNRAHYELISQAIDDAIIANKDNSEPQTILITFGTANKYLLLELLRARDDIRLISPLPYLEMAQQTASQQTP